MNEKLLCPECGGQARFGIDKIYDPKSKSDIYRSWICCTDCGHALGRYGANLEGLKQIWIEMGTKEIWKQKETTKTVLIKSPKDLITYRFRELIVKTLTKQDIEKYITAEVPYEPEIPEEIKGIAMGHGGFRLTIEFPLFEMMFQIEYYIDLWYNEILEFRLYSDNPAFKDITYKDFYAMVMNFISTL